MFGGINQVMPSVSTAKQRTFPVEEILASRKVEGGKYEFLVKWKNFDTPTWQPIQDLKNNEQYQEYRKEKNKCEICNEAARRARSWKTCATCVQRVHYHCVPISIETRWRCSSCLLSEKEVTPFLHLHATQFFS